MIINRIKNIEISRDWTSMIMKHMVFMIENNPSYIQARLWEIDTSTVEIIGNYNFREIPQRKCQGDLREKTKAYTDVSNCD